jgi:YD repeat-containing protein
VSSVDVGLGGINICTYTGEKASLTFEVFPTVATDTSYNVVNPCYVVSGSSRGRDFSISYQQQHDLIQPDIEFALYSNRIETDHITQTNLTDGAKTITANFTYSNLTMNYYGTELMYSIACPGPDRITDNYNNYIYSYQQSELEGLELNPPANNILSRISAINVTGPQSYTRTFTYDDNFNVTSETGPDGIIAYTYHIIDNADQYFVGLSSVTHGIVKTEYGYDGIGRLTSVTQGDAPPTVYTYDANGNIGSITDPNGNVTNISYDETYQLFPATITSGERVVNYEYGEDPFGWLKSQSFGPYTTSYTYDDIGRVLTVTDSAGTVTTEYTDLVTEGTDENGNTVAAVCGLQVLTTDYEGHKTRTTYDPLGRKTLAEIIEKNGVVLSQTGYAYDPQYDFRLVALTRNGETENFSYNDQENTATVTDTDGNATTTYYDALGRKTKVIATITGGAAEPGSQTVTYTYDQGLLTGQTEPGRTVNYTYNSRGLVETVEYSDGKTESYSYDGNGNVLTAKGRDNREFVYDYDGYNSLLNVKSSSGAVINAYSYDNLGRLTAVANGDSTTCNYYDDQGYLTRAVQTIKGRQYNLNYEYGAFDRLETLTLKDVDGNILTGFGYDYAYPKTTVSAWDGSGLKEFASVSIGTNGLIASQQLANGISQTYAFDQRNRLNMRNVSGGGIAQTHQYAYDKGGNIGGIDGQGYQYDSLNRLTGGSFDSKNVTYEYDPLGNRTQGVLNGVAANYTYADGLLKAAGDNVYQYNADGSLAAKASGADHWNYRYK